MDRILTSRFSPYIKIYRIKAKYYGNVWYLIGKFGDEVLGEMLEA